MGTYSHSLYDKKELDVYLRVPGNSDQNTDLDITLGPCDKISKFETNRCDLVTRNVKVS